jgi:hypothetical protein
MEKTIQITLSQIEALFEKFRGDIYNECSLAQPSIPKIFSSIVRVRYPDLSHLKDYAPLNFLEALEMHIINNEDDWCRNPRTEFEMFKQSVSHLKEVKNDVTNDKGIGLYLTNRIKQLNEADAAFCDIRWQQGLPIDMNMAKRIAREESNKVTFARQELEMVLKLLNSGKGVQECDASKAKSMGEPMAQNKSGQQLTECYVPVTNDEQLSIDFDTSKAMALGWFPSPHGWLKEKK